VSLTNHRANKAPAPCCQCQRRIKATCCVDEQTVDEYDALCLKPRCYCASHCPVCGKEAK
jgi:hypothetical protein